MFIKKITLLCLLLSVHSAWSMDRGIVLQGAERLSEQSGRLDLPSFRTEIQGAIEFLLARIHPDGSVRERTFSGALIKGEWMVDYGIGPITESLRALSAYLEWTKSSMQR